MYAHHESRVLDESAKYSVVGNPSARSQPAPGASSEGNVDPGATSGKDTKHERRRGGFIGSSRCWSEKHRQEALTFFRGADGAFESKGPGAIPGLLRSFRLWHF